jgi:hypothetical protein
MRSQSKLSGPWHAADTAPSSWASRWHRVTQTMLVIVLAMRQRCTRRPSRPPPMAAYAVTLASDTSGIDSSNYGELAETGSTEINRSVEMMAVSDARAMPARCQLQQTALAKCDGPSTCGGVRPTNTVQATHTLVRSPKWLDPCGPRARGGSHGPLARPDHRDRRAGPGRAHLWMSGVAMKVRGTGPLSLLPGFQSMGSAGFMPPVLDEMFQMMAVATTGWTTSHTGIHESRCGYSDEGLQPRAFANSSCSRTGSATATCAACSPDYSARPPTTSSPARPATTYATYGPTA